MFKFSARSRISFGLVCIVTSLLMMAIVLGLTPDQDKATIQGRARLSESIALASSSFILHNQIGSLEPLYQSMVQHNPDLKSIGLRTIDGNVVLESGNHLELWKAPKGKTSTDQFIRIPLMDGDGQEMGTLELTCEPLHIDGFTHYFWNSWTPAMAFLSVAGFITFSIYMGRMLEQLDPSKAVPTHVRSALNNLTEGLLVMDRKGRIVLANQAFAEIVGIDENQLIGKPAAKLAWQGIEDNWITPWDTALRLEAPQANIPLQMIDKVGELRTFNANCSPVLGTNGDYRGVLASFDDITQLEEKKAQLRLAKDAAEAASRAKSEFLANMSHEIRTPMNAILGFTDVLRRGLAESKKDVQHYLDTIHNSGKHLLELINDILDLSKVESGQFQVEITETHPHTLITELLSVLRVRAEERGIKLSYESNGTIPETIQTDPTRFRQIITNLVGNAIKFTERGCVKVVTSFQDGIKPMLQIDVIDTGIGMQADTIENIFNPFQQADASVTRRFGGTGLGLAISQKFARHLGGDIVCQSKFGLGSTFSVTLETGDVANVPFVDAKSLHKQQSLEHETVDPRTLNIIPSRILVVDDGDANRQLISLILKRAGMSVSEATNGEEAIELISSEMPFDLVFMDMQMPIKDGYTTTTELRESGYEVPIFALTGNAMKGDEEKCLAAGCTGFLTKPVDLDLLLKTLAEQFGTLSDSDSTAQFVIDTSPLEVTVLAPTFPQSNGRIVSTLPLDDLEFREIVEGFISRLHQQVRTMQNAFDSRNYVEIARLAHWLKGAGGTVGFPAFSKPAVDLEVAARQQNEELVRGLLAQITDLESRVHMPDAALLATNAN